MLEFTFQFLLAFGISVLIVPFIIYLAEKNGWLDIPNARKLHTKSIPSLGGIAIYLSLLFSVLFFSLDDFAVFFLLSSVIFLLGVWDDFKDLSASIRLIVQFAVALTYCFYGGLISCDFGLLGLGTFPIPVQYILTCFWLILFINAFNLIDGINGLAGGLAFIISLSFSFLFALEGSMVLSSMALVLAGGTLGFLIFNFGNASIFLGDNGSTLLGFLIAVFFLQYINLPTQSIYESHNFILGFSLISIPIFDLIRVSVTRLFHGKSPFSADQTHIHHLLLKLLKTHKKTAFMILFFQLVLFVISFTILPEMGLLQVLMISGFLYLAFIKSIQISLAITAIKDMELKRRRLGILN